MRDIHFFSLFCVDFDYDIMEQWVENIKRYGFKSYTVVLNSPSNDGVLLSYCASYLSHKGFTCTVDGRKFGNMRLRVDVLKAFQEKILREDETDYLCVCDSDEFPMLPPDICKILKSRPDRYFFVKGEMVDRWAKTLINALQYSPDIFARFPCEGNLEGIIYERAKEEHKQYFFKMCREKFIIFPDRCEMDMTGCHVVHENPGLENPDHSNTWPCIYKIMHFTWREGIIDRMKLKSFNHPLKISAVEEFFTPLQEEGLLCSAMT